jgi:TonB family protein
MSVLRFILSVTLLSPFATAAATPPRAAPAWQVDWGDQYCSLIRLPDRGTAYVVAVRVLPGSDYSDIFLVARGDSRPPDRIDRVTLAPSGRSFNVSSLDPEAVVVPGARAFGRLPLDFWDALAGSQELQLLRGGRVLGQVHLTDAAAAVGALRQCVSDVLREWHFDETAWHALRRHPVAINALGINDQDYPREAIRQNIQGRVVVRVDVSAEGRVTSCAPVSTSHTPVIDAAACHAAMTRGRFTPALNGAGQPTAAQFITTVTFVISP